MRYHSLCQRGVSLHTHSFYSYPQTANHVPPVHVRTMVCAQILFDFIPAFVQKVTREGIASLQQMNATLMQKMDASNSVNLHMAWICIPVPVHLATSLVKMKNHVTQQIPMLVDDC